MTTQRQQEFARQRAVPSLPLKRILESGEFATIAELAEREGIAPSYMTRVLRLTLLVPDIVDAVLDGKQRPEVTLTRVLEPFPVEWGRQRASLRTDPSTTSKL